MTIYDSSTRLGGLNKYGLITTEQGFKINILHELTHAHQTLESASGDPKCPLGKDILISYYTISFNKTEENYNLCRQHFNYDWKTQEGQGESDFVTTYHPFPSEDMAEAVAMFKYAGSVFELKSSSEAINKKQNYIDQNIF